MHQYPPAQLIFRTKYTSGWVFLKRKWGAVVKRKDGIDGERKY